MEYSKRCGEIQDMVDIRRMAGWVRLNSANQTSEVTYALLGSDIFCSGTGRRATGLHRHSDRVSRNREDFVRDFSGALFGFAGRASRQRRAPLVELARKLRITSCHPERSEGPVESLA